ncbi:MAG: hypothetical protein HRU29_00735 [Rhizobiales bacterium]|nr:hypothetical protein [Hyphomicrobiales bacterium]NRB12899.1 hypothetical protein [Hyphomicrobiales bacterium]
MLSIIILTFAAIEALNILVLYFRPGTTKGNGLGAFTAYEKSRADPELFVLIQYLINWVAGTKLIFVCLLVVIGILGDDTVKLISMAALILSIASYYWRLHPIIKKLDDQNQIIPKGYSKTLGMMIGSFIGIFFVVMVIQLITT